MKSRDIPVVNYVDLQSHLKHFTVKSHVQWVNWVPHMTQNTVYLLLIVTLSKVEIIYNRRQFSFIYFTDSNIKYRLRTCLTPECIFYIIIHRFL